MKKEVLERMVRKGFSTRRIAKETGRALMTVRFWLNKHGLKTEWSISQRKKQWTDDQMLELLSCSLTISDVLRKLGLSVRPGNYETVHRFAREHKIDLSHMKGKCSGRGGNRIHFEDVFVVNSKHVGGTLKRMVEKSKLLKNECSICGQKTEWMGKPLVLVLDHINGVNNDNRIENLRMLCPHCNSQQDTFCGRNKKGNRAGMVIATV